MFLKNGEVHFRATADPLRRASLLATSSTGQVAVVTGTQSGRAFTVLQVSDVAKYAGIVDCFDPHKESGVKFEAAVFGRDCIDNLTLHPEPHDADQAAADVDVQKARLADVEARHQANTASEEEKNTQFAAYANAEFAAETKRHGCRHGSTDAVAEDEEAKHYLLAPEGVAKVTQLPDLASGSICSLAFSADSTVLAVGCGGAIFLYEHAACLPGSSGSAEPFFKEVMPGASSTEVSWSPATAGTAGRLAVMFEPERRLEFERHLQMYDVHGTMCTHDAAPRSPAGITAVCWAGDGAELLCGFEDGHVATHNPSTLAEVKRSANPRTYLANATQLLANGWDYGGDVLKEEQHAPKEQGAAVADVGWLEKDANITFHGSTVDMCAAVDDHGIIACHYDKLCFTQRGFDEDVNAHGVGEEGTMQFPRHKSWVISVPDFNVALAASSSNPEEIQLLQKGEGTATTTAAWSKLQFFVGAGAADATFPQHTNSSSSFAGMAVDFTASEKDANITFKGADLDIEAPPSPRLMMLCSNGELSMYTLADKMHVASDFQGGYPMMKPKRQPDPIAAVVPSGPAISPEPRFGGLFKAGPVLPPAASVNPVAVPTNPATPFVSFSQTATILAHDPPVDPAGAVAAEKEKQRQKRVDETKAKNAAIKKLKAEISGDWCTAMENLLQAHDDEKGIASDRTVMMAEIEASMATFKTNVVQIESYATSTQKAVAGDEMSTRLRESHYNCIEYVMCPAHRSNLPWTSDAPPPPPLPRPQLCNNNSNNIDAQAHSFTPTPPHSDAFYLKVQA